MADRPYETDAEADNAHLMVGKSITVDEIAAHLSAIDLRLRQLARAAETPDTPVELAPLIESLRGYASNLRDHSQRTAFLARIIDGDALCARHSRTGEIPGELPR